MAVGLRLHISEDHRSNKFYDNLSSGSQLRLADSQRCTFSFHLLTTSSHILNIRTLKNNPVQGTVAVGRSPNQKINCIKCNTNVHDHAHNSPPLIMSTPSVHSHIIIPRHVAVEQEQSVRLSRHKKN